MPSPLSKADASALFELTHLPGWAVFERVLENFEHEFVNDLIETPDDMRIPYRIAVLREITDTLKLVVHKGAPNA